jgi:uncharacterized protein YkwD
MKSGSIWAGLVSLVLMLASCSKYITPVTTPVPATPSGTVTNGNMEEGILANINAYRRSKGLAELQMTGSANRQAAEHSRNMATGATSFGHDGFQQRISNIVEVIGKVSASAENVAFGMLSAKQVVDGWLRSSGHKRNIEGNYNLTGVGVYSASNGDLYFTQIFLKK